MRAHSPSSSWALTCHHHHGPSHAIFIIMGPHLPPSIWGPLLAINPSSSLALTCHHQHGPLLAIIIMGPHLPSSSRPSHLPSSSWALTSMGPPSLAIIMIIMGPDTCHHHHGPSLAIIIMGPHMPSSTWALTCHHHHGPSLAIIIMGRHTSHVGLPPQVGGGPPRSPPALE